MATKTSSRRKDKTTSMLYPLDDFYAAAGLAIPKYKEIDGAAMLEPYRSLLVHQGDMTPALENHYRKTIHIRRLQAHNKRSGYTREVVLLLDGSERPVEFGAIKIYLEHFSEPARKEILKGKLPLGAIMREYKVEHGSRPKAFLQIQSDGLINEALSLPKTMWLYGRRNTLITMTGEPLAEIVEILSPAL
jgi:chorismate-pyruvate lyase